MCLSEGGGSILHGIGCECGRDSKKLCFVSGREQWEVINIVHKFILVE